MHAALVIMATGIGSRYGGSKQTDGVGPHGEILMEYGVYDAVRAGFDKVVFIIKPDMRELMERLCGNMASRLHTADGRPVEVRYAYQDDTTLPTWYTKPAGRTKPFGTAHAVLCTRDIVHEPFCVINADDFYGAEAYKTIGDYLAQLGESRNSYCMVAYDLNKTLSENGTVSRGVCGVDPKGDLTSMVERTQIERMPDGQIVFHDNGADEPLSEDTPVSMNLFGFTPDFFTYSKEYFKVWFEANKDNIKSEFYIPTMVNKLIGDGTATLRVLRSAAQWHGVTYKEDKPALMAAIEKMIAEGKYPRNLWA